MESDEPLCPRCGNVTASGTADRITSDRTTSDRYEEPIREIKTSLKPRKGLIPRIEDALAARKQGPIPEPGREGRQVPKMLRFEVLARDEYRCRYCGRTPPEAILEMDHALSWRDGGATTLDNLVTSCRDCNRGKSSRSVDPRIRSPIQFDED